MPDLPQVVLPAVLYNALICALASAASWHAITMATIWLKKRRATSSNR